MAAKMFFRDAGVLRTARKVFFRDAGVLRTVRKAFYRDAGVLRVVYLAVTGGIVTLTSKSLSVLVQSPGTASITFRLATGGKLRVSTNGGAFSEISPLTEWLDPEDTIDAENYDAQATLTSNTDSATVTGTFGSRLQLGAAGGSRDWGASITTATNSDESASPVVSIQIIRRSDSVTVATASVTFNLKLFSNLGNL